MRVGLLGALCVLFLLLGTENSRAQFSQQTSLATSGVSGPIYLNTPGHPFTPAGVAILFTMNGTGSCTVQVSGDPINSWPPPKAGLVNWNNHDVLVSQTASANSNLAYPVTAIRLNCAALSGGTAVLTAVQY